MGYWKPVTAMATLVALVAFYATSGPGFDPASVRGKRVLITDATTGLGEALALEYARLGARLLLAGLREARLRDLVDKCRELGAPSAEAVVSDATKVPHRGRLLGEAERLLGGLDHLVLNHADCSARAWLGSDANLTDLDRTMDANFFSYVDLASTALPLLGRDGGGAIGVASSLVAQVPVPLMASYSASEAALRSFFSSLRLELRRDRSPVTVTTFLLGSIADDAYTDLVASHFPAVNSHFVTSPPEAASAVVRGMAAGPAEVIYPTSARFQYLFHFLFPEVYEYNWHYLRRPLATSISG